MDPSFAIVGTLVGVIIGGLVNFWTTRTVKQQEWRQALARDQIMQRQRIYADFLAEVQRLMVRAVYEPLNVPADIQILEGYLAQIWLTAPDAVVERARGMRKYILLPGLGSQDFEPGVDTPSWRQLRERFVEYAREDLRRYSDV